MALDYKLHKATEDKIDELVQQKLDLKRREDNLAKLIEQFQKDNKQLIEDKKVWEEQKSLEFRRIKDKDLKARGVNKEVSRLLKSLSNDRYEVSLQKKALDEQKIKLDNQSQSTKRILRRVKKQKYIVISREKAVNKEKERIAGMIEKAESLFQDANDLIKRAKEDKLKSDKLLLKAEQKNKEANGLKIQLGIKERALGIKEKELSKQQRDLKFRRTEVEQAAKELQLKRQLLTKAYTLADVQELDTKVEQMLASGKK